MWLDKKKPINDIFFTKSIEGLKALINNDLVIKGLLFFVYLKLYLKIIILIFIIVYLKTKRLRLEFNVLKWTFQQKLQS